MNALLRRTKIVATLGPATDDPAVLSDIVRAGVDVVRLNFSHGAVADHARRVELVREAARRAGRYVGVLGDLQGPKIRIDRFVNGKVQLADGAEFTLDAELDPDEETQACRKRIVDYFLRQTGPSLSDASSWQVTQQRSR